MGMFEDFKKMAEEYGEFAKNSGTAEAMRNLGEAATSALNAFRDLAAEGNLTVESINAVTGGSIEAATGIASLEAQIKALGVGSGVAQEKLNMLTLTQSMLIGPTLDLAAAQIAQSAAFNKATGAAGAYNNVMQDAIARNLLFDPAGEKTSEVIGQMFETFNQFTMNGVSPAEEALVDVAVALNAFGVSSEASVEAFQLLRTGFSQSETEIANTVLGLENFAEGIGVSTSKMITDFNSAMPTLAMFGSDAERVFRETAAAAKSSGFAISEFLDVMDLTDTFEQSTNSAQMLNAILGGRFIDSFELLNAETPTEKMKVFQQALQSANVTAETFNNNRFLARAFVDAIPGIDDTAELIKLTTADFDSLQESAGIAAKTQGEVIDKVGTALTPDEALDRILRANTAVAEGAKLLASLNESVFPTLVNNVGNLSTRASEALKPILADALAVKESLAAAFGNPLSEEVAAERAAAITERARQSQQINIQLLLDGKLITEAQTFNDAVINAVELKLGGR